jgi:23S rRNA pseudouridine2604 synthase
MELTRLNKAIAATGHCSRRAADKLIELGVVKINGKAVVLGDKVSPDDEITVDGKVITKEEKLVYLMFNKPVGITCTTDLRVEGNIIEYINYPKRIYPIGRLDKPSEGLIFLTNDGDIVNKILRSRNNHEKEYIVSVDQRLTNDFLHKMRNGVHILDTITKNCEVEAINDRTFSIILTQGLNRQIRRMCEELDYNVTRLSRKRIINIELGDLKAGEYREFEPQELAELQRLVSDSKKTIDEE